MRRTGRTTKMIAKSISELLETGETIMQDHEEHSTIDQKKYIFGRMEKSLKGLLGGGYENCEWKVDYMPNTNKLKVTTNWGRN